MRATLVRRLADLPLRRKLALLLGLSALNLVAVIALAAAGLSLLSSLRAYVGGEGLWAKAQKNALLRLERYALTRDERDYDAFAESLKVPLGDRRARLALQKSPPDLEAAEEGLIAGGNHPQDAKGLVRVFTRFGRYEPLRRAIFYWGEADDALVELQAAAADLRAAVREGAPRSEVHRRLRAVDDINARLTSLEDGFSFWVGEASRRAARTVTGAMLAGSFLLGALGLWLAAALARSIAAGVEELSAAAGRASLGDFAVRIRPRGADELGRLAADFNRMIEALSKLDRMKKDFVATVSHELRTPLTLALAPLETLLADRSGRLDAEQRRLLEIARNSAVRQLALVNGLLDFSRLEAGKTEARREPLELGPLVGAVVADFRPAAEAKRLTLELSVEPESAVVSLDRYLTERILFNLLSNAVKFTPPGGSVRVRARWSDGRLTLSVADTGVGIALTEQPALFQKFRQVDSSSTRRFEGTGLGLALVKEFAALLGGTARVDSRPGAGSVFTVECEAPRAARPATRRPAARTPLAVPLPAPESFEREPAEDASDPRPRVLLVEDNAELSAYLALLLGPTCRTRVAHDGAAGLRAARLWRPDLVLADVMMPVRDGLSLCRDIKADAELASTPVVLLTALTDRDAMLRGWEAGADEYLFKPFHPGEVLTRVRTLLAAVAARKRASAELEAKAAELKRSNADLEQFAFAASHDLKEPLRKILGFSRLLDETDAAPLDEQTREVLKRMTAATERMDELIDDLLRFSRAGRGAPAAPTDAGAALDRALSALEVAVRESGARVERGALPRVLADEALLATVFQNLLANALKFRAPGRAPAVRVSAERRGAEVEFSVSDDGIGFEPEYAERVFGLFERLHPRSRYPGSGLGLATCRRVVERYGGRIHAESLPGQGTTVRFTLPAA